tara:strand:- start:809 stop:1450 length:642 start_codon:yes stop_codon:yes gene_type:complete
MALEFIIPTTWKEVKLKNYRKYMLSQKDSNKSDIMKLIEMVSFFCETSTENVSKIGLKDLQTITNKLSKLLDNKTTQLTQTFYLNGITYGFINNWDEITIGEYADIEEYIKKGFWENAHHILSIFYRPIIVKDEDSINKDMVQKEYVIEPYTPNPNRAKDFLNISMDLVLGATNFFLLLGAELMTITSNYTIEEAQRILEKKKPPTINGDGMQ